MIRDATADDIPDLVEMGRRFHGESPYGSVVPFDEESFAMTLDYLIREGALLVVEDGKPIGMAGGLVFPLFFNLSHRAGQELFWWLYPEHRGKGKGLLHALEERFRERNAGLVLAAATEGLRPDAVGAVYRRRGYVLTDHTYMKVL